MSNESVAYLRITPSEARALLNWFLFQEHAHREEGEKSTLKADEINLANKIKLCIQKIIKEPNRYGAVRLSPDHCRIVYSWYENLPDCLIDDVDADIHASVCMFLMDAGDEID